MHIQIKRQIQAPANQLWAYLADYSNIHRFHPLLTGSHFVEGTQSGEIGSKRQCDFRSGDFLKEEVTDWQEGSHYTVHIYDTSMPICSAQATLGIRPLGDQETEAFMHIQLEAKHPLLAPLLYLNFRYFAGPGILRGLEQLYREETAAQVAAP